MKILLILFLLPSIAVQIRAQATAESCQTSDHRSGRCVSIRSCNSLFRIVTKPVLFPEDRNVLLQSQCGDLSDYVCCTDEKETTSTTTKSSIPTTSRQTLVSRTNTISAQKCREYADFAYNKTFTVNVFSDVPRVTKTSNCAFTSIGLVIGGEDARRREFPHQALIGFTINDAIHWDCGGTLISEQFVLSAYHCIGDNRTGPPKYVRLGEHDLGQTNDSDPIDFNIIQTFSHDNAPRRTYNDIILFKLDRNVTFNYVIRPACLPEQVTVPEKVIASGWGHVRFAGTKSDILQKVQLETFSKSQVMKSELGARYSRRFREETIVFAGHLTESKDTCQGDSGGPLQILHETLHCTYTVVGVVSTGDICGVVGVPAVYTGVYSHISWIEGIVWPNE